MALLIGDHDLDRLIEHARRAYPEECCGILIGTQDRGDIIVRHVVSTANIAEGDRRSAYQVDWKPLLIASRESRNLGRRIVGFYHSHPNGHPTPSAKDLAAAWPNCCHLIIPLTARGAQRATAWHIAGDRVSSLIIRPLGNDPCTNGLPRVFSS